MLPSVPGVPGLAGCKKEGFAVGSLGLGIVDEWLGEFCLKATEAEGSPEEVITAEVTCAVRVRAGQLTRALQTEARGVEGWKLFAPLQIGVPNDPGRPSLSLGHEEGVKVGYGFVALNGAKERVGFFKTTNVGPGGEAGIKSPSALEPRLGDAKAGARLEEYPQTGLSLMPHGAVALLTYGYGDTVSNTPAGPVQYGLASVVFGGGASVGYDLSPLVSVPEVYLRVGVGILGGRGTNLTVGLIPIDLAMEKGFYLGGAWQVYGALGPTMTFASVKVDAKPPDVPAADLSAKVYGALTRVGVDALLGPSFSMRLGVFARMNFNSATYSAGDGQQVPDGFNRRRDHFATLGPELAVGWSP
jgi:hypothetical protein